jgi:hypothetical protein
VRVLLRRWPGVVVVVVIVIVVMVVVVVVVERQRAPRPSPNSARYSGAFDTTWSGVPSQQTWPLRQITRSDALITTCRSWLTIRIAQPVSRRTSSISR